MKSGSTSIERQSDTHAPQWMQAMDCVTSIIVSGGTTYSRSGGSPAGKSHGTTRCTFFQWTASMFTIRSFSTGMLPIGSTVISPGSRMPALCETRTGSAAASLSLVLQASLAWPLMRTPHEPQIAAWHEQRMPIEPSSWSFSWRIPSSTLRCPSRSTV